MRKIILYIAFATIALSWLFGWTNSCGIALLVMSIVLMLFVAVGQFIIIGMRKKHEDNDNREQPDRNYVYWDYESEPGCWAHNDSLFSLMVCRTDKNSLTDVLHVDEGWEVESAIHSEPTGACLECESTIETRKNGLVFQYNYYWKEKYEWLLQFDFIIRKTKCSEKLKRSVPLRKTKCSFFGFPPHTKKRLRFLWGVSFISMCFKRSNQTSHSRRRQAAGVCVPDCSRICVRCQGSALYFSGANLSAEP